MNLTQPDIIRIIKSRNVILVQHAAFLTRNTTFNIINSEDKRQFGRYVRRVTMILK
jgi:hypothetical protein